MICFLHSVSVPRLAAMPFGSGGHWISFRRLAEDGWFDLNSLNASARLIVSADTSPEVQAIVLVALECSAKLFSLHLR